MKYRNYTAEDFFQDENFRNWILRNDPSLNFFWEKWLLQNPDKKKEVEYARKLVLSLQFKDERITEKQKQVIWQKIQVENNQLEQKDLQNTRIRTIQDSQHYQKERKGFTFYFYRSAAAILLLFVLWFLLSDNKEVENKVAQSILIEKENPPGQKSKIQLVDGSVVYLNANSKISYLEDFEEHQRIIHLAGEAFFEVAKDSLRPFIVVSGGLQTQALGTQFNIKAFPEDDKVTVTLLEGKVKVKDHEGSQSVLLQDQQAVSYASQKQLLQEVPFVYAEAISWKDGLLYFQQSSLSEVISRLERWYGVEIQLEKSADQPKSISGSFENENLENVLRSISFSAGFEYQIKGKKVSIKF